MLQDRAPAWRTAVEMRHDEQAWARHSRGVPRRSPLGEAVRRILVVLTVLAVSATGVAAIATASLAATVRERAVSIGSGSDAPKPQPISGAFSVLLVGADNAAGQHGWGAARQSTQNDVDILVHIDADHRSGTVLSFPRDLVVDHPACTDPRTGVVAPAEAQQPLNTDLNRGGLGCVVKTLSTLTGLRIPYAAEFSFAGTVAMADAVGGVPVCVTKAVDDPDSGLKLRAGWSTVSGRTALAYLRDRHGVGDGSDLARISSQQAYMSSLLRVATSAGTLANPVRLSSLADAVAKNVTLSTTLADPTVLVGMMLALKSMPLSALTFVEFPNALDPVNPNKVIPAQALDTKVLARLQAGRPLVLAAGTHGYSTVVRGSAAKASTKHAKTTATGGVAGLYGQTAAQVTCSQAA